MVAKGTKSKRARLSIKARLETKGTLPTKVWLDAKLARLDKRTVALNELQAKVTARKAELVQEFQTAISEVLAAVNTPVPAVVDATVPTAVAETAPVVEVAPVVAPEPTPDAPSAENTGAAVDGVTSAIA